MIVCAGRMPYVNNLNLKEYNMSQTHDTIKSTFETYVAENDKFSMKGVKASATRARKALQLLSKAIKVRRKEITAEKEALAAK